MKLVDVNLLLYAVDETSSRHDSARSWVEGLFNGEETVMVKGWLSRPNVVIVDPTDRHLTLMGELLGPLGSGGNLVIDGHLAALAIEHGAELCSSDADFGRFPGLRWTDPLR